MGRQQLDKAEIFITAAEIEEPSERAEYLTNACREDRLLRAEIEELLEHDRAEDCLLDRSAPGLAATVLLPLNEKPCAEIGPYKLREQIGEGGFGIVYIAEQTKPIQRKVALKVIKPGMDTREVIARFDAERQALALMDHPNIAKALDAGTTEFGHPYFVMELVRGVPITAYCDQQNLRTNVRLKLFIDVCRAVQHQKGIIHRDIKPTNVLVTLHDGEPVPKVIDFGIAKALSQKLTERTIYTSMGQMIGTPLYMSPEQAELSGLDVDTRSDVYSLGVLLYELLTGTTPFDKETLKELGLDEIRRLIREIEPAKPSARISTLDESLRSTICDRRRVDPRKLAQSLKGELDWIVMKALEKDRTRRYDSPSAFAADVELHLDDESVQARPPSTWYRFGKLIRKRKAVLLTSLFIAASLIVGSGVAIWQLKEASAANADRERIIANEQKAAAQRARDQERRQRKELEEGVGLDQPIQSRPDIGQLE